MIVKCIYCSNEFDCSKGKGDHIIPAVLGEFRNDIRFRGVCRSCNNGIGKSEQQLLQCGPESFFRDKVVPTTTRSHGQTSSHSGALGMPPPQFRVETNIGPLKAYPTDDGRSSYAPDQLIIYDEQNEVHHVELFEEISSDGLRKKVKKLQLKGINKSILSCDESRYVKYLKIISEGWPESREERLSFTEHGKQTLPHEITIKVSNHYFRAIAKIAFHYFLVHSSRYKGHEDYFFEIRDFIINGGKIDKFFKKEKRFQDMDAHYVSSCWVHLLAASEENNEAIAYVCLFKGPDFKGVTHQVNIGKLPPSPIIIPRQVWAHCYEYDSPAPKTGKVGIVHSSQIIKQTDIRRKRRLSPLNRF